MNELVYALTERAINETECENMPELLPFYYYTAVTDNKNKSN